MNKRQVIILWTIAVLLGITVAAVKISQNDSTRSATKRTQGKTLFESFPAEHVASIEIQGTPDSVTLTKQDGKWTLPAKDGFPANATYVNDFLRTLSDLKVTLGLEAGPSFAPRFGMDEASTKPDDRGLTAIFKDASGKEIAKVSLGKTIDSNAAASPMGGSSVGRYVRNHADDTGFYAVSEMFPSISADAKRWLAEGFVSPEKVKSISVTQPGKSDIAWKVSRDGEEAEFKLDGATGAEVLDTAASSSFKSILSYARFDDVIAKNKVADQLSADQKRTVTIDTFEGFTYTLTVFSNKTATPPATPGAPAPAAEKYFVTVDVSAELPKERKKEESEKPEDAKTKDTAFTNRLKSLTEKLTTEKALAGITFEVSTSTVETLVKDRATLIAKPAAPQTSNGAPMQNFPGGMVAPSPSGLPGNHPRIEAVTPPISIPEEDIPDEDDNE